MRHDHEPTGSQDTHFLAGIPAKETAARGSLMPAARAPAHQKKLHQKEEADPSAVAALTQTLVAPMPPHGALLHALTLGSRLLPCMRALSLYATPDGTRASLILAGELRRQDDRHDDGTVAAAHDIWQPRAALGYGDEMDRRVLEHHTDHRTSGATALPLLNSEARLVGVLLVEERDHTHARERHPQLDILAHCLAALLERQRLADAVIAEGRARDEFISLAAHELRSPLTSIKGYAQLLVRQSRKIALPDPMRRSVEAIEQQSLRMSEMVGELLDASRIRRGALELQPVPTDLVPLARRLIEKRQTHFPRHTISVSIEAPSLVGNWDMQRVEQILRDLLDNAARYSPEGGVIAIALTREDGTAAFRVRDEGIGVTPGDRERIFDYLYRAPTAEERNLSGLGLGLYICRHLAQRMGGQLTLVETQTGLSTDEAHGSEFELTLPLT